MLDSAPAFRNVAAADLARLAASATALSLRDAQSIFARGDEAGRVYLILSGTVRISTLAPTGKRIVVEIFKRGELFGEIAAIDGGHRTADATAMGPTDILAIPVSAFREIMRSSAPLANNLLRMANQRLRRTYSLLEDASLHPIEMRLAKQVLYLVRLGTTGDVRLRLRVRMNQDELADLLGITARSVITVLNKWRGDGLVEFDGRTAQLTIIDLARFRALVGE
jgi:CRP-like cAMP-binding protein